MEKKTYLTPNTELVYMNLCAHLLNWSADKVPGGGGNVPEAKPVVLDDMVFDEDDETMGLVIKHHSVWED